MLDCEDAPKWHGYSESCWKTVLQSPGDSWEIFNLPKDGVFPDPDTLDSKYDVMVISGSHYSAYEDIPWINKLVEMLPKYAASKTRIIGCCFGHQILGRALGGAVGKNPSGRFV